MEVWKDIKGYEGSYQISSHGRVKSLRRWRKTASSGYYQKERMLSRKAKPNQYITVSLSKNNEVETLRIHRLVAEAFIPNLGNKEQVNHINLDKQDNNVENLEWVTPSENINHAMKHKPNMVKGIVKYNKYIKPRRIEQYTLKGSYVGSYINAKEAGKANGVCSRNILQVASKDEYIPGKTRKQAGGYVWRYKDEVRDII